MDLLPLIVSLAAGLAVLLIILAIFGQSRNAASERLEQIVAPASQATAEPTQRASMREVVARSPLLSVPNRVLERRSWSDRLARDLARADLTMRPIEYLLIRVAVIVGMVALFAFLSRFFPVLGYWPLLIVAALIGFVLPGFYVGRRQQRRLNAFNDRLADTITLLANALRSGSSLLQATELVTRETQPPISTEFSRVIREVQLGLPIEHALQNLVRRVRSSDLELMATAITIQYQVGGNLAEILDTIAFTIRERVRIKGEIRVLTAQQRLSGIVVALLPLGLLAIVALIAPQFMQAFFDNPPSFLGMPLGVALLALGGVSMFIGFLLIRRIVDIDV